MSRVDVDGTRGRSFSAFFTTVPRGFDAILTLRTNGRLSERNMKKSLIVSLLILAASTALVGCKSGFGSCFSKNGSRVPAIAETSSTEAAPIAYDEVVMMQTNGVNSVCDPCAPNACSPCDPCGSARGASAAYPAAAYPGVQ